MKLSGEQNIPVSRKAVWAGLNDPDVLRQSIPGCQSLERVADDRMTAVVEVKIGPIAARFNGEITISEKNPPESYVISGAGQGGAVGNARGGARVRLTEAGGGTLLSYEVEAQVGGRLAQLGGPVIDATAKQLAARFFSRFGEIVGGQVQGGETAVAQTGAVVAPAITAAASIGPDGLPWGWIGGLIAAMLAGFMLGHSEPAEQWALAVAVVTIAAASAGYHTGLRKGARP